MPSIKSILADKHHYKHPFEKTINNQKVAFTSCEKTTIIVAAIAAGILVPIVGSLLTLYGASAYLKVKKIQNLKPASAPIVPSLSDSLAKSSENLPSNILEKLTEHIKHHRCMNAIEYMAFRYTDFTKPHIQVVVRNAFQLNDHELLAAYTQRHDLTALPNFGTFNALYSTYFKDYPCFSRNGGYSKDSKDQVVYTPKFGRMLYPDDIYDVVKSTLDNELTQNVDKRPSKIIYPMFWTHREVKRCVILFIEPSSADTKEARITMLNTRGNNGKLFWEFEQAAMKAAKEIYTSPKTVAVRNEKLLAATLYSSLHDCIEIARKLAEVPNIQEAVQKGLPRITATEDAENRIKHGEDLLQFYQSYFN